MKKLLILGLFLILNSSFLLAPTAVKTEERKQKEIECTQKEIKYNDLYKSALSKLREFEGLRLMPYADSHGASIGYGHFIRNGEHFTKITELEAEILLKSDFETAMKTVENNTAGFRNNLVCKITERALSSTGIPHYRINGNSTWAVEECFKIQKDYIGL